MYLLNSIIDGLKILGFDKETIKKVSREKSLEEIFLSTLFLNYIIVLVIFLITSILGGLKINGRFINLPVFYGILLVYPFTYNLFVYFLYGFFGLMAEMLNKKKVIKPLISVGFHTAIVYSIIIYLISLFGSFNLVYGSFLLGLFILYFLYTMFLSISIIYNFSFGQSLMVLLIPLLLISIFLVFILLVYPNFLKDLVLMLFIKN